MTQPTAKHTLGPWTWTAEVRGYMIYFKGKPKFGAGTMGTNTHTASGKPIHWKHRQADLRDNCAHGQRECDRRNAIYFKNKAKRSRAALKLAGAKP